MQKELAKVINRIMQEERVTQDSLAKKAGLSQAKVNHILNNRIRLSVDDFNKICNALNRRAVDLMELASEAVPPLFHLSGDSHKLACSSDLSFQLFNRLKKPISKEELLSFFEVEDHEKVFEVLNLFLKKGDIIEKPDGTLVVNAPPAGSIHFTMDDLYNDRIVSLYRMLRPMVMRTEYEPPILEKWKKHSVDALYLEYFTAQQAEEQNRLLRDFLGFLKQQLKANRRLLNVPEKEQPKRRLRMITIVSAPFPDLKEDVPDEIFEFKSSQ